MRLKTETLIKAHIRKQGGPERIRRELSSREKIVRKAFEKGMQLGRFFSQW